MNAVRFREELTSVQTLVVKIGSKILTGTTEPEYRGRIRGLVRDLVAINRQGIRTVLVSSGAIARGMESLNLRTRPTTIPLQQACASIGQIKLTHSYSALFSRYGVDTGQVLLTWDDLRDKRRYLNLRNTLYTLLDCNAVPIVNENDSVGVEEINFGDNDTLGAQIALLTDAQLYVMLTDVDGLYDTHPSSGGAQHIPLVPRVTRGLHDMAGDSVGGVGVGGMITKLKAAEIVTKAGSAAIIGNGFRRRLRDVVRKSQAGTLFLPSPKRMSSKRRWLAFTRHSSGRLVIDRGAQRAVVNNNKSLLPAGIKKVYGTFKAGDLVDIQTEQGALVARGLTNYSSADTEKIRGHRSTEIVKKIGHSPFAEVIHRDNLVLV